MEEGALSPATGELSEMCCPRCGARSLERFYGPCRACRIELVAGSARQAENASVGGSDLATDFVPRSNVVPNHVATKD